MAIANLKIYILSSGTDQKPEDQIPAGGEILRSEIPKLIHF
jgi:hypothetical protein